MARRISPLSLTLSDGKFDVTIIATGVQSPGAAGTVAVAGSAPAVRSMIGPLSLPMPVRVVAQISGVNVTIVPTGVEARGQIQELLGAHATISPDSLSQTFRPGISIPIVDDIVIISINDIENLNATTDVPVNYTICDRTGFRLFRENKNLVEDGYGMRVRQDSMDMPHPQDKVESRGGDKQRGPDAPEADDVFITADIDPSDL